MFEGLLGIEYRAGVSFGGGSAQLAVLKFRKDEITLIHLEEIPNDGLGGHWYLRPITGKTAKPYRKLSAASVAFDNTSVEMHLFPIDTSLTREEQHEHTQWEASKLIPGYSPKEHLLDIHTMKTRSKEQVAELFIICASRPALLGVKSALGERRIELEIADISFFGGEYALLVNYPEVRGKNIALVEVGERRVDMGVLSFGRLSAFRYAPYEGPEQCVAAIEEFLPQHRVAELYLHGAGLSLQMQEVIAKHVKVPLVRINPFRRILTSKSPSGFETASGNEHRFAAAIGVALRKH